MNFWQAYVQACRPAGPPILPTHSSLEPLLKLPAHELLTWNRSCLACRRPTLSMPVGLELLEEVN